MVVGGRVCRLGLLVGFTARGGCGHAGGEVGGNREGVPAGVLKIRYLDLQACELVGECSHGAWVVRWRGRIRLGGERVRVDPCTNGVAGLEEHTYTDPKGGQRLGCPDVRSLDQGQCQLPMCEVRSLWLGWAPGTMATCATTWAR